jgi:hypothetical protein
VISLVHIFCFRVDGSVNLGCAVIVPCSEFTNFEPRSRIVGGRGSFQRHHTTKNIDHLARELERLAFRDLLTGIPDHRYIEVKVELWCCCRRRCSPPAKCAMNSSVPPYSFGGTEIRAGAKSAIFIKR